MFFERFLVRLGLVLAPFLAPKLAQNRLKIASRRFLRPYFFKNADFHADLRFPRFFHQNRPQDEAKIGLRSPQDGPKTVLKTTFFDVEICLRFWSVWGSILVTFGAPFGSQVGAQIGPKFDQKSTCAPRRPQDRPRSPKSTPRAPQERPKRHPEGTQKAPKSGQEPQKGSQQTPLGRLWLNVIAVFGHGLALSNSFAALGHGLALSNSFGACRFQLLRFTGLQGRSNTVVTAPGPCIKISHP